MFDKKTLRVKYAVNDSLLSMARLKAMMDAYERAYVLPPITEEQKEMADDVFFVLVDVMGELEVNLVRLDEAFAALMAEDTAEAAEN